MSLLKNKQAGEKILSIWWFAILILIGTGIVIGTLLFFSKDIDVRQMEADILSNRISLCLTESEQSLAHFFATDFDLFKECLLNKELLANSNDYYISIRAYNSGEDLLSGNLIGMPRSYGNIGFEEDCSIEQAVDRAEGFPKCAKSIAYGFNSAGGAIKFEINVGSNYQGGK